MAAEHEFARIDFAREVERLHEGRVGPADGLHLWGGTFEAERLQSFLDAWAGQFTAVSMPCRIWEYTDSIHFIMPEPPDLGLSAKPLELLERGRLFGAAGDLSLRRDSDHYYWHFIGDFAPPTLPPDWEGQDFWASPEVKDDPNFSLHRSEEPVLLWGELEAEGQRWHDDRVARADLRYLYDFKRVRLVCDVFSYNGQTCFVWWKRLEEY